MPFWRVSFWPPAGGSRPENLPAPPGMGTPCGSFTATIRSTAVPSLCGSVAPRALTPIQVGRRRSRPAEATPLPMPVPAGRPLPWRSRASTAGRSGAAFGSTRGTAAEEDRAYLQRGQRVRSCREMPSFRRISAAVRWASSSTCPRSMDSRACSRTRVLPSTTTVLTASPVAP